MRSAPSSAQVFFVRHFDSKCCWTGGWLGGRETFGEPIRAANGRGREGRESRGEIRCHFGSSSLWQRRLSASTTTPWNWGHGVSGRRRQPPRMRRRRLRPQGLRRGRSRSSLPRLRQRVAQRLGNEIAVRLARRAKEHATPDLLGQPTLGQVAHGVRLRRRVGIAVPLHAVLTPVA